jgi:hypothetical protein
MILLMCYEYSGMTDEKPLRALGPDHGHRASGVRAELVGCQAEKCLLLPGDDSSPNKLTMPPVAIECVRNIRREVLALFWEACHVAQHNVTKPDHIRHQPHRPLRMRRPLEARVDEALAGNQELQSYVQLLDSGLVDADQEPPDELNYLTEDDLPSERPGGHWS